MTADDRALQAAIALTHPQSTYRIRYRIGTKTGTCPGQFSADDAAIWLVHLNRVQGSAGFEYWAEPPLPVKEKGQ